MFCFYPYTNVNQPNSEIVDTICTICIDNTIKGALSSLRQFLATENPLKMMKSDFYFTSIFIFILTLFIL